MTDTDLITWLAGGAPVALPAEELAARRASEFARRFVEALRPVTDLGPTDELHQAAVARNVFEVHREANALGEVEYDNAWKLLDAPNRRAIKAYISMALTTENHP